MQQPTDLMCAGKYHMILCQTGVPLLCAHVLPSCFDMIFYNVDMTTIVRVAAGGRTVWRLA